MTLSVHTSRITYPGPDRLDITRKSGGVSGLPFAPSWAILGPALAARRIADQLMADAHAAIDSHEGSPEGLAAEAERIETEMWQKYAPAYLEEMRASYRRTPGAWRALMERPRVVLVCYCTDPERCHRTILGREILPKLGATYVGEIGGPA